MASYKSFASRLEALEKLEAAARPEPPEPPAPRVPPAFDVVLAGIDLVTRALGDGRAHVCRSVFTWQNGEPASSSYLCHMPDPEVCAWGCKIEGWLRDAGLSFTTAAEYVAWLEGARLALAFCESRTDAELEAWPADDLDPLFYSPDQRAVVEAWVRLVEEGGDG